MVRTVVVHLVRTQTIYVLLEMLVILILDQYSLELQPLDHPSFFEGRIAPQKNKIHTYNPFIRVFLYG